MSRFEMPGKIPLVRGEDCWEFPYNDDFPEGAIEFVSDNRIGTGWPYVPPGRGKPWWDDVLAFEVEPRPSARTEGGK